MNRFYSVTHLPKEVHCWSEQLLPHIKQLCIPLFMIFLTFRVVYDFSKSEIQATATGQVLRRTFWQIMTMTVLLAFYQELIIAFDRYIVFPFSHFLQHKIELKDIKNETIPKSFWANSYNPFKWVMQFIFGCIQKGAISLIINIVRDTYIIILYTLGPFALVINVIPGMEGTFKFWVKKLVTVFCWAVLIAVLDIIFFLIGTSVKNMWYHVVLTILYLHVPTLTSSFLNSAASASAMAKVTTLSGLARISTLKTASVGKKALFKIPSDGNKLKQLRK